jgi:HSP20 family protein
VPEFNDDEDDDENKNTNKEEDEDDVGSPFDFTDFFNNPQKFFKSKQFMNLFKEIFEKIRINLPPEFQNLSPEDFTKEFMKNKDKFGFKGPFMYGFNVNLGPNGPKFDSFGNIKSKKGEKPKVEPTREPLVEINEESDKIIVIAEMPGVTKEDVEIKTTSRSLTISTKPNFGRTYYKEVELPSAINSDYAKASLRNGILCIKLKKFDEKQTNIVVD